MMQTPAMAMTSAGWSTVPKIRMALLLLLLLQGYWSTLEG